MGITGLVWINDGQRNRAVAPDKVVSMEGWVHGRLGVKGHKKTHCKRGHEFAPETFRVRTKPNGNEVRDCLLCEEERHQAWYKAHPDAWKVWRDKYPNKYKFTRMKAGWKWRGIDMTISEYEHRLVEQGGVCALCGKPPVDPQSDSDYDPKDSGGPAWSRSRLVPDHDHETGVIRGLIHSSCNLMIGQAKDSPTLLELAAQYLRKHLDSCLAKAVDVHYVSN